MDFIEQEAQRIKESRAYNDRLYAAYQETQTQDIDFLRRIWPEIAKGLEESCAALNLRLKKVELRFRTLDDYCCQITIISAGTALKCDVDFESRKLRYKVNLITETFAVSGENSLYLDEQVFTPQEAMEKIFKTASKQIR